MSKIFEYIQTNGSIINTNPYFIKLFDQNVNLFILSNSRFNILLDDFLILYGVLIIKFPTNIGRSKIVNLMYEFNGGDNYQNSNHEKFKKFLDLFDRHKTYNQEYYNRYSLTLPFDKLSVELCKIFSEKSWIYCIGVMIMIEHIMLLVNQKLNQYFLKITNTNKKILNEEILNEKILNENNSHISILLELLKEQNIYDNELNDELNEELKTGLDKGKELLNQLYLDLSGIFV